MEEVVGITAGRPMYSFGSSSRYSAYLRKAEAIFMGSALHHFGSREMLLQHLHECKVGGDKTYMPGGNQMAVARSSLLITSSPRRPAHLSGPRSAEPWCLPPDRQNCQAISGLESEIPAARRKLWPICIQGGGGHICGKLGRLTSLSCWVMSFPLAHVQWLCVHPQ